MSHVVLRSILEFDEGDSQVRFDEATRNLILIKHHTFEAVPLNRSLPPIQVESHGKVENVRFSLNHRFAAVQRNDTELEFMDLLSNTSFTHLCKGGGPKRRWRILSFHWTGTPVADFVVATTAGIEFYLVLPEKSTLKLVKVMAHSVAWVVYSHVTRLILLATGPQDNLIHGIQIQSSSLVRIPKFEVVLAPPADDSPSSSRMRGIGHAKLRRSLLPGNLSVVRLYDMIFCAHVETEKQQVHLYQLFKDFVVKKYALAVYSRTAAISVSDNLLVVHAIDSKVALIFDLRINAQVREDEHGWRGRRESYAIHARTHPRTRTPTSRERTPSSVGRRVSTSTNPTSAQRRDTFPHEPTSLSAVPNHGPAASRDHLRRAVLAALLAALVARATRLHHRSSSRPRRADAARPCHDRSLVDRQGVLASVSPGAHLRRERHPRGTSWRGTERAGGLFGMGIVPHSPSSSRAHCRNANTARLPPRRNHICAFCSTFAP